MILAGCFMDVGKPPSLYGHFGLLGLSSLVHMVFVLFYQSEWYPHLKRAPRLLRFVFFCKKNKTLSADLATACPNG